MGVRTGPAGRRYDAAHPECNSQEQMATSLRETLASLGPAIAAAALLSLEACEGALGAAGGVVLGGAACWLALRGRGSRLATGTATLERAQRSALDGAGLLVVHLNQGRISEFNASCERLSGRTAPEVIGTHLSDHLVPESHAETLARVLVAARTEETTARIPWQTATGERRLIDWRVIPVDGEKASFLLVGTDRSELLASERELVTLRAQAATAFETGPFGLVTLDRDGRVQDMNRGAREIFGGAWGEDARPEINLRTDQTVPELSEAVTTALSGRPGRVCVPSVPLLGPRVGGSRSTWSPSPGSPGSSMASR